MKEATRLLSIREVARQTGLTSRTLRYYEEKGLIRPQTTCKGAIRCYNPASLSKIEKIRELKEFLGFCLDEIKLFVHVEECCPDFINKYESLAEPDEKRAMLENGIKALQEVQEIALEKMQGIERLMAGFNHKINFLEDELLKLNGGR